MLLIVSVFMIPVSLKKGPDHTFGYTEYFLLAALTLIVVGTARETASPRADSETNAVQMGSVVLVGLLCFLSLRSCYRLGQDWKAFPYNPETAAYYYVKNHPGEAYFPANPLAHILGESQVYHVEIGVEARVSSGLKIDRSHLARYMPPRPRFIATYRREDVNAVHALTGEFSRPASVDDLPGWTVYVKDSDETRAVRAHLEADQTDGSR